MQKHRTTSLAGTELSDETPAKQLEDYRIAESELIPDTFQERIKLSIIHSPTWVKSFILGGFGRIGSWAKRGAHGLKAALKDPGPRFRGGVRKLRRELDGLTSIQLSAVLIAFTLFLILPLISVVAYSFTDPTTGLPSFFHFFNLFEDTNIWPWHYSVENQRWYDFSDYRTIIFGTTDVTIQGWDFGAIINSIYVAIIVTGFSVLLGVFLAFIVARYDFYGKPIIRTVLIFPLLATPFVGAIGIKAFLGLNGFFNNLLYDTLQIIPLQIQIKGLAAIIFVQALSLFSLVYLNAYSSFMAIDPSLEEQAENLGAKGSKLFRSVTLPLAMPGIQAGAILTFILSIEDLGTPIVFREDPQAKKTLAYQVFDSFRSGALGIDPKGPAIGIILLIFALAGFLAIRKYAGVRSYESGTKGGQWNPRTRHLQHQRVSINGVLTSFGWILFFYLLIRPIAGFPIQGYLLLFLIIYTIIGRVPKYRDRLPVRLVKSRRFTYYSIITIIGWPLLLAQMFISINNSSVILSLLPWLVSLVLYTIAGKTKYRNKLPKWSHETQEGVSTTLYLYAILIPLLFLALIPQISVIILSFAGPWASNAVLPSIWTLEHYSIFVTYPSVTQSIIFTLIYGAIATVFIVLLGTSAAYIIARRDIPGKTYFDLLVTSPIALPGIVIATGYFLMYFRTPFFPLDAPAFLIIMSYTIRKFPFTVRAAYAGLQSTPVVLEEASQNMGASKNQTFAKITLPLIGVSVLAGSLLSFVYSVSEVSTSLILGSLGPEQAPMTFWTKEVLQSHSASYTSANSAACLGVLMMAMQMTVITVTNKILGARSSAMTGI